MEELLGGLAVGLVLSIPVGPMGVLAILKQHEGDTRHALGIAVGVSTADALLALVATLPADWLSKANGRVLSMGIAVALWGMAWSLWRRAEHPVGMAESNADSHAVGFSKGFFMTVGHPFNVASYVAGFSIVQAQGVVIQGWVSHGVLVAGVFAGTLVMWLLMLQASNWLAHKLKIERIMPLVRRGVATVMAVGGGAAAYQALL